MLMDYFHSCYLASIIELSLSVVSCKRKTLKFIVIQIEINNNNASKTFTSIELTNLPDLQKENLIEVQSNTDPDARRPAGNHFTIHNVFKKTKKRE